MAGGGNSSRELDRTPTWAVALVCAVIIIISIILEKVIHHLAEWFQRRRKKALLESLEKVKGELMVLGFISLLLTFCQNYIAQICIPVKLAETMLPCRLKKAHEYEAYYKLPPKSKQGYHRKLLLNEQRLLAADSPKECNPGSVPLITVNGLHQLHIFIFFLAVFHVFFTASTMMLGRSKIRSWKEWEQQISSYSDNDAMSFRLVHESSFVKRHTNFWTKTPFFFYIACFFRQFFKSVRRADYETMRNGFICVHVSPGSKFNFQQYIKRSLEDDFKAVVGISPLLWVSAVIYLLLDVDGWKVNVFLSALPLIIILAVGAKLQAIITRMAVEVQERHAVIQGIPLVQVSDNHFWFGKPKLVLYLIHLALFQNAFELTYFVWTTYEFGVNSCFHDESKTHIIFRVIFGLGIQVLCSYITLPLYALVTQMGSTIKRTIFDEQTSTALKNWRKDAMRKKHGGKPSFEKLGGAQGKPLKIPTTDANNYVNDEAYPSHAMADDNTPASEQPTDLVVRVEVPGEHPPHR